MYKIYCGEKCIYDPENELLSLIAPKLTLKENTAGALDFTILNSHPYFDSLENLKSEVRVLENEEELFAGRILTNSQDLYNRKRISCEGELAYLNDSVQGQKKYKCSIRQYLEYLIDGHNEQVEENRQFQVGMVTVSDSNNLVYKFTNYESTMQVIKTDLLKTYGGHLRVRKEKGVRYLDYLKDYPNRNSQTIYFGRNLLDFTKDIDASTIATVLIPLGAKIEETKEGEKKENGALEKRVTIESVNNGSVALVSPEAVKRYGKITKTVQFNDVHVPANLLRKGKEYLHDIQFENVKITAKVIDLHIVRKTTERIKILDEIRVVSEANGLNRYFPVTELTILLDKPSSNTITLGQNVHGSMTGSAVSNNSEIMKKINEIPSAESIVDSAVRNATELIKNGLNGHVVRNPDEELIMDTNDIKTARKVWRWNLNGLGYSRAGYNGPYDVAITMDGQIVGKHIVGGSVSADKLDINYRRNVEKQIERSIEHTDRELKKYWTTVEVENAIQNSKDGILLQAREFTTSYTTTKLNNYMKSSDFKVKMDEITSEVKKKINASEWSTKIRQSATDIRIAWNNISKYIQFEYGELCIYDSAYSNQKLRAKFNDRGNHFYRDGTYVGKIGTNNIKGHDNIKGLVFDLERGGSFMSWGDLEDPQEGTFKTKWMYISKGRGWEGFRGGILHAGCDIDMHGYTLRNVNFEGGGINGTLRFVTVNSMSQDGTVNNWTNGCYMEFKNGVLVNGSF